MLEVLISCEGQTEREFCRSVLKPYLAPKGIHLSGKLVGKPTRRLGGIRGWRIYREEILRTASENSSRHVGLLVDYYGMPDCRPGRTASVPHSQREVAVENALKLDLPELNTRFHPCIQLHEFESLLYVDPEMTALSLSCAKTHYNHEAICKELRAIKEEADGDVQLINDSSATAPSKRIISIVPGYDKVGFGVTCTADVTVDVLREGCRWLDLWLTELESLVSK